MKHTDATKRMLSEARRGEKNPFFGKKHTSEFRAAQSARTKEMNANRQYDLQPVTIKDPSREVWAYVAGLVDGEGSIAFKKGQPTIVIYNCHRPLMEWLKNNIGGSSRVADNRGRQPNYCWSIGGARNCAFFIGRTDDFLIIKKDLARDMLMALVHKYGGRLNG